MKNKNKKWMALALASLMTLQPAPAFAAQTVVPEQAAAFESQTDLKNTALGFYQYVASTGTAAQRSDAKAALGIFGDGMTAHTGDVLDPYTHIGDAKDATSLTNMKGTIQWLKKCNALRKNHNRTELKVSLYLMAVAQKQTNWSNEKVRHSGSGYLVGENLSWGYSDPFVGWYDEEKLVVEGKAQGQTGHYYNIIDPLYTATGFALTTRPGNRYGTTHGQVFETSGGIYTVSEFETLFNTYYQLVQSGTQIPDGGSNDQTGKEPGLPGEDSSKPSPSEDPNKPSPSEGQDDGKDDSSNPSAPAASRVMYRVYNPNSGEHFYTGDKNERRTLIALGWKDEGIGWTLPEHSSTPVYRLYNPYAGDHHYTVSQQERKALIQIGWKDEGIGWYSDEEKTVPVYRQYNPNAVTGSHNYTTDWNEYRTLVSRFGWKDEGIAWYGAASKN